MPVLTIVSSKGGCGKTTIATSLAAALAREGFDVGLLDADPNGGAHRWAITTYTGPKMASYAEPDKDRLADLLPIWPIGMRCSSPTRPASAISRQPSAWLAQMRS